MVLEKQVRDVGDIYCHLETVHANCRQSSRKEASLLHLEFGNGLKIKPNVTVTFLLLSAYLGVSV